MCLKNSVKKFLINWRKIEEQLFDQAKQTLNSGAELQIIEAFEYARDNYGKLCSVLLHFGAFFNFFF